MYVKPLPEHNHLLAALPPEAQDRLFPHLELVTMPLRGILYECGRPRRHVYFPTDSIISVQYLMQDGASTAILVVGNEGLLGVTLSMGEDSAPSRSLVQSAGYAYRLPRKRVMEEFNRHGEFMLLMFRYTQALITHVAQTAVCNRHHTIDQQLCRWLLLSMDRLSHNRLTMTQAFIGNMLGVRREGVTQAATKLRNLGVISYHRGLLEVLDRPKLETLSCECYEAVLKETKILLNYLPQRQTIKNNESISKVTLKTPQDAMPARPKCVS
ncbi:Crp/Fnr family transcriptional regulator [Wenzhouxiangella sp. XN24]|uniref:Crp/Fnr family transcriptional regulator n=1 Tax=Wenzhouxiangella sp. XN24 TaxID=2713569 RepID=UPI0013EA850E|nr:Crp/Fnr family transcriptional regulator [Wenzhouxiangella sp. XN24]NGX17102.1 Crp/Fnr family transcriptional regulator [Wenzhouxiangella sp. XN24]